MKKGIKVAIGAIVGIGIIGNVAGGGDKSAVTSITGGSTVALIQTTKPADTKPQTTVALTTKSPVTNAPDTKPTVTQAPATQPPTTKAPVTQPPAPQTTSGEMNALKKAESYLRFTAFSKKGLLEQLKFEGFSTSESTYAANNVEVDWMEQAALKAESYLKFTSFSKKGLLDQLKFEGFTTAQAEYGVEKAY